MCLLLFLHSQAFPQVQKEAEKQQSNIEKFSAKSGTLTEKRFIDVGKYRNITFQILVLTDLLSKAKVAGVRIQGEVYDSTLRRSDTHIAFLDPDEVDGLIKSIGILRVIVAQPPPKEYTEIEFVSRGGFQFGCFYGEKEGKWSAYCQIRRYSRDSLVFLDQGAMGEIEGILKTAQSKLPA
jgi:hypothetical protein